MVKTPVVFGLSMARRHNRRALVAVTYISLALGIVATSALITSRDSSQWWWILDGTYCLLAGEFLRRLVEGAIFPDFRPGGLIGLRLSASRRPEDMPDERDIAVRNAACFEAYRALAIYIIALWCALPALQSLSDSLAARILRLLLVPSIAMALTLPYAIVLWREPDVAIDAHA